MSCGAGEGHSEGTAEGNILQAAEFVKVVTAVAKDAVISCSLLIPFASKHASQSPR